MGLYEPSAELSAGAKDMDRIITSLIEELEAINYYNQRAEAAAEKSVKELMLHNRNEEIEHACMLIEWLRRSVPKFGEELKTYLFTEDRIVDVEDKATGDK